MQQTSRGCASRQGVCSATSSGRCAPRLARSTTTAAARKSCSRYLRRHCRTEINAGQRVAQQPTRGYASIDRHVLRAAAADALTALEDVQIGQVYDEQKGSVGDGLSVEAVQESLDSDALSLSAAAEAGAIANAAAAAAQAERQAVLNLQQLLQEVARRRNFAIISHPDAGKTTLTEKLLLYGGAIHEAGEVRASSYLFC